MLRRRSLFWRWTKKDKRLGFSLLALGSAQHPPIDEEDCFARSGTIRDGNLVENPSFEKDVLPADVLSMLSKGAMLKARLTGFAVRDDGDADVIDTSLGSSSMRMAEKWLEWRSRRTRRGG